MPAWISSSPPTARGSVSGRRLCGSSRLGPEAQPLAAGGEEEIHAGVTVVRSVLLVEADRADDVSVRFDREPGHVGIRDELVGRLLGRARAEPAGDLGLFEDLDEAWLVVLLEWSQRHALPSERGRHGDVLVPVTPVAPVAPVPPAASGGSPATDAT